MWERAWKLPVLRRLSTLWRGFAGGLLNIGFAALCTWGLVTYASVRPGAELLRSLAEIGATLLIAYVLEVSWIVRASRSRPLQEREDRLGWLVGMGAAGLVGIVLALVLSERVNLGHWIWLDELGFGWSVASLGMLGITVVLQPLLVHQWMDDLPSE